jgi:hypothetical protein
VFKVVFFCVRTLTPALWFVGLVHLREVMLPPVNMFLARRLAPVELVLPEERLVLAVEAELK